MWKTGLYKSFNAEASVSSLLLRSFICWRTPESHYSETQPPRSPPSSSCGLQLGGDHAWLEPRLCKYTCCFDSTPFIFMNPSAAVCLCQSRFTQTSFVDGPHSQANRHLHAESRRGNRTLWWSTPPLSKPVFWGLMLCGRAVSGGAVRFRHVWIFF